MLIDQTCKFFKINLFRNQQNHHNNHRHENEHENNRGNVMPVNKFAFLFQYLPFVVVILFILIPYLKNSVFQIFKQKPYFSFSIKEDFYKKQITHINKIAYYVGDNYLQYYKTDKEKEEVLLIKIS